MWLGEIDRIKSAIYGDEARTDHVYIYNYIRLLVRALDTVFCPDTSNFPTVRAQAVRLEGGKQKN